MNKALFALAILLVLTAWSIFAELAIAREDQGVNDYAKAHWNTERSCVPFVRKYESVCGSSFSYEKGLKPEDKNAVHYDLRASTDNCQELTAEQLPIVQKGQIISVYLQQAYIKDFSERGEGLWEKLWGGTFGSKRGEIAIVARVAELDNNNDFDFTAAGRDRGRLIYYSEGVQPGQYLNFSQLPIYGPIEYTGKPLVMEFYIIELDVKENTEISGMLSAAAGLGAVAYPPASPILKVLDTIGGGLLKANKNDLEFKYHAAILAGDTQLRSLKAGMLEFGNYAFVRMPYTDPKEPPSSNIHRWSRWWFNQKNARIYEDEDCSRPLLTQTYFTVQLNRAKEGTTLDASNSFQKFLTKLTAEAEASTTTKTSIISGLQNTVEEDRQYRDAKKLLEHANQVRWPSGKNSKKEAFDPSTKAALKKLIKEVCDSLTPPQSGTAKPTFAEAHAESLVEAFNRLLGAKPPFSPFACDAANLTSALDN
jgi:hypothetical protein